MTSGNLKGRRNDSNSDFDGDMTPGMGSSRFVQEYYFKESAVLLNRKNVLKN